MLPSLVVREILDVPLLQALSCSVVILKSRRHLGCKILFFSEKQSIKESASLIADLVAWYCQSL